MAQSKNRKREQQVPTVKETSTFVNFLRHHEWVMFLLAFALVVADFTFLMLEASVAFFSPILTGFAIASSLIVLGFMLYEAFAQPGPKWKKALAVAAGLGAIAFFVSVAVVPGVPLFAAISASLSVAAGAPLASALLFYVGFIVLPAILLFMGYQVYQSRIKAEAAKGVSEPKAAGVPADRLLEQKSDLAAAQQMTADLQRIRDADFTARKKDLPKYLAANNPSAKAFNAPDVRTFPSGKEQLAREWAYAEAFFADNPRAVELNAADVKKVWPDSEFSSSFVQIDGEIYRIPLSNNLVGEGSFSTFRSAFTKEEDQRGEVQSKLILGEMFSELDEMLLEGDDAGDWIVVDYDLKIAKEMEAYQQLGKTYKVSAITAQSQERPQKGHTKAHGNADGTINKTFKLIERVEGEELLALLPEDTYVDGKRTRTREGQIKAEHFLPLALGMAREVHSVNQQGVLHRDLQLNNFMVKRNENNEIVSVKLIDFSESSLREEKDPRTDRIYTAKDEVEILCTRLKNVHAKTDWSGRETDRDGMKLILDAMEQDVIAGRITTVDQVIEALAESPDVLADLTRLDPALRGYDNGPSSSGPGMSGGGGR